MKKTALTLVTALTLTLFVSRALAGYSSGTIVPAGTTMLVFSASCPSGWTDVTATYQGRVLAAKAATGAAGDTLGTEIASTADDLTITATANACATVNFVATAGTTAGCSPAFTPTVTLGSTANQRSELTPLIYVRLCQK